MERAIKYKALVEGFDGFVYSDGFLKHKDGTIIIITKQRDNDLETSPIIKGTLCEFTGLKDKEGVDIYESDVVSDGFEKGVVIYNTETAEYLVDFTLSDYEPQEIHQSTMWAEVIGNLHTNPELLEQ